MICIPQRQQQKEGINGGKIARKSFFICHRIRFNGGRFTFNYRETEKAVKWIFGGITIKWT